jgi:hypothetical protein
LNVCPLRAAADVEAGAEAVFRVPPYERFPSLADAVRAPLTTTVPYDAPRDRAREWKITVVVQNHVQAIAQAAVYEALTELKNTGMWIKSWRNGQIPQLIPKRFPSASGAILRFGAASKRYQP